MSLQETVGRYIKANETTMEAVADRLGISRSSLFNKIRGSNEFSLSEAFGLSKLLGISIDELYQLTAGARQ